MEKENGVSQRLSDTQIEVLRKNSVKRFVSKGAEYEKLHCEDGSDTYRKDGEDISENKFLFALLDYINGKKKK